MVGAFLALGMPAPVVIPAVLGYRAIAIWTPVPAGAAAMAGLRRTVRRWAVEDGHAEPADEPERPTRTISLPAIPTWPAAAPLPVTARIPRCERGPPLQVACREAAYAA
jgi:hypothetical protein